MIATQLSSQSLYILSCTSFHDMTSFFFAGFCPRTGCEKCTTRCSPAYQALKHCKYLVGQMYHLALIKRYRTVNDYSHNSLCVGISMVIPLHALCRNRSTECRMYAPCKFVNNQRIKLQQDYCCIEIVICKFSHYLFVSYSFILHYLLRKMQAVRMVGRIYSLLYLWNNYVSAVIIRV